MLLIGATVVSYVFYGPYYSPDTVNYFNFSKNLFDQNPWSAIYSPFYPFLLHCLSLLPSQSLFRGAHFLILIQYALDLFFLYRLARISSQYYRFSLESRHTFILLILIVFHSWWSYRMFTWAHADASFYTLLIAWFYFMANYQLKASIINLLIISILAAAMIWVKLNALALVLFFGLLLFIDKNKFKWLIPLFFTFISYVTYRLCFPTNAFENEQPTHTFLNYLSIGSLELLWNNLGAFFQAALGFFVSDVVTSYIPQFVAGMGGILLLVSLIYIAYKEWKRGIRLSSFFILVGLAFLLCQLAFQQMIQFEEINYRTLFPFFLGGSWLLWIKLISLGRNSSVPIFTLCLMITLHTITGHFWLWQRQDVNSLFEVEKLVNTELLTKLQSVQDHEMLQDALWFSDYPVKLALLMDDPFVTHYAPEAVFLQGKRRAVTLQEKQRSMEAVKESLLKGEAVLVLFGEDQRLMTFAQREGLLIMKYPDGVVLYKR